MSFLVSFCLSLSSIIFAAPKAYDVRMNIALEGNEATLPPFILEEGSAKTLEAVIDGKKSIIEILAKEDTRAPASKNAQPTIQVKMKISTVNEAGEMVVVMQPRILTQDGKLTEVSEGDLNGQEKAGVSLLFQRR